MAFPQTKVMIAGIDDCKKGMILYVCKSAYLTLMRGNVSRQKFENCF